jgi:hypothetical protein
MGNRWEGEMPGNGQESPAEKLAESSSFFDLYDLYDLYDP